MGDSRWCMCITHSDGEPLSLNSFLHSSYYYSQLEAEAPPATLTAATPIISPPPYSTDSSISAQKMQLATLLDIPTYLVGSGKDASLRVAYEKYRAYLAAVATYDKKIAEGTWTLKKLNKTDLIEIFVSRSFYFSHYRPCFGKLSEYPKMMTWLENGDEVDDLEVWGMQKDDYVFKDLDFWLKNNGSLRMSTEKGKKVEKGKKKADEKEEGKKNKKKKVQKNGKK